MTAKERVAKTFQFEKTDRVTIGYDTNPIAHKNLCDALGVDPKDDITFLKMLGVDYVRAAPVYTGPKLYEDIPGRRRNPENGAVTKYIENQFGGYWDFCDFPLKGVDDEAIYNYPFPDPDCYDYDSADAYIDRKNILEIGSTLEAVSQRLGYWHTVRRREQKPSVGKRLRS